jgi:hypothetical protein
MGVHAAKNSGRAVPAARSAGGTLGAVLAAAGVIIAVIAIAACGVRPQAATGGSADGSSGRNASASPQPGAGTAVAGTVSVGPGSISSVSPGPPIPPPRPRLIVARGKVTTLTESDNGDTVVLRIGMSVTVVLGTKSGLMWDRPAATGQGPLAIGRTRVSGGYPTRLPARAVFVAVRPGRAFITSTTDAPCLHATPRCMIAQQVWRVTIIVRLFATMKP